MAKDKLITDAQIKKSIKNYSPDKYIELILEIAQGCPQAREFLTLIFTENQNMILEKYMQKVQYEFYPPRGFGRLNLREAKTAIADFKKICSDKIMVIDLMLFYVENCVEFTNDYGDIGLTFYNSAVSVFSQVVKEINSAGKDAYEKFAARIQAAVDNTSDIGWGFHDNIVELYYEIEWIDHENE